MKKVIKVLKETKVKGSIFFSVIALALVVFSSLSLRMMKGSYSMVEDTGGADIYMPSQVILGAPSGWEQYRGSVVYNWDDFQIEIYNNSSYQMTDISYSLTGTGTVTGDNGGSQGFEVNNFPSSLDAGDSRTARGYGTIVAADNWTDTDQTMTISYKINGTTYNVSKTIHFYSYEPVTYSSLPHPDAVQRDYTYVYTNNSENLYIRIPRTNIYMDKSETLESFDIKPLYKSAFGNTVIVEHPQTGNTDNYFGGASPRLWDYFSYSKVGNSTDYTLWSKTEWIDAGHNLWGTPTTTTDGVVNIYLPIYAHYCKKSGCNWTGYNYTTNDNNKFNSSDHPILNVSIYNKSGLYDLIYEAQVNLDKYDVEYYNTETYQGYIDEAVRIYNTRVTTQPEIDAIKVQLNTAKEATPTEKNADYSALATALQGINSNLYTTESWNTFNTVYVESQDIYQNQPYKKKQQKSVDNQVTKLNAAKANLVLKPADYSAVNTAITNAEAARDTQATVRGNSVYIYTDNSRQAVTTAINAVVTGKTLDEQSTVDGYTTAINNAASALVEKDADYSLVTASTSTADTAISQTVGNVTLYTDDSISAVNTAINAVVQGKKITEQSTVDGYATAIDQAVAALEKRSADYSALNSAVNAATTKKETKVSVRGNQVYLYTDATRSALETVLNGISYNKKIDEQTDVDNYVTSVNTASAALVEKAADYTDVNASIDAATTAIATKYQEELLYTTDSITAVQTAINAVTNNLTIERQDDIDTWKSNIDTAVSNLVKKPADYSALNSAVNAATTKKETKVSVRGNQVYLYTDATRSALETVLNGISYSKTIDEQTDVDGYTTSVNTASAALAEKPADYTSINSTISDAETEIAKLEGESYLYTAESRTAVQTAINAVVSNLSIDRQDDIDTWETAIQTAVSNLEENTSDYSAVDDAVAAATTKKETKVSVRGNQVYLYTQASREAVEAAIAAVEENLPISSQDQVDQYADDINDAADALEKRSADYTDINASINTATTTIAIKYQEEFLYTTESITTVQTALNAVTNNLTIERQDDIDTWKSNIDTAVSNLVKKDADYSAVDSAITAATTKKNTTASVRGENVYVYTDATRQAVQEAINAVVTGKKLDEQDTVDGYATAINSASDALVKKNADYTDINISISTANAEIAKTQGASLLYTQESINAVTAAINAVTNNLTIERQDDIDTWKSNIDTAVSNLVVSPADYSGVNTSIDAATTAIATMCGNVTLYTDDSIAAVNAAINAVVQGKDITEQTTVDGYATAIDQAVASLEKRPADYTELNSAKAAAIAKRDTQETIRGESIYIYTTTTRDNLTTILNSIDENLKIDEQSRVDGFVTTINSAADDLVEKDANYDLVNSATDAANTKIATQAEGEDLYTSDSISAVQTAISAVETGRKITSQAEVDGWADAINTAANAMVKKDADYSAVDSAISAATTKKNTTASVRGENVYVYTDATRQAVQEAINAVVTGKKLDEQDTVDGYATAINSASDALVKKNADYTDVNTSIDAATTEIAKKVGEKLLYTTDSISAVQTAINAVTNNLTIERQDDIDTWKSNIDTAVSNLVISPADYSGVNTSIDAATTAIATMCGNVTLYTDDSITAVQTAINAVVTGKDITEQTTVDGYATAIDQAVASLEKKPADYSALNSAISAATTKKNTTASVRGEDVYVYTDATRTDLETIINSINYNLKIDEQTTVNGYVTSVNSGSDALVKKNADYTEINASIDAATTEIAKKVGEKLLYTTDSITAVQTAINAVTNNLTIESQDDIDTWKSNIDTAVSNLVVSPADYSGVNTSIDAATTAIATMCGNVTLYTDDSIAAVQTAINAVVTGKDITEQTTVDGYATAIDQAVASLEKRPADYSALNSAKAAAIAKRDTQETIRGESTYIYTDGTRADVSTALAAVVETLKIDEQSTVDSYTADINTAANALTEKDADYSLVTTAVTNANSAIATTAGNVTLYTDDSIAAVQTEINKVINGRKITSQAEVDGWATSINNAVSNLVKKDADYSAVDSAISAATTKKNTTASVRGENVYVYTAATRQAVQEAIDAVVTGKKLDEQDTVDGYATAINSASDALVKKNADYTDINTSIDAATTEITKKFKEKNLYTDESIAVVQAAINAVEENLTIERQDDIDAWKTNIDNAVAALEKTGADYTAVQEAIDAATAKKETKTSARGEQVYLYTQATRQAVDDAIAAVEENLPIESQSQVNGYATAINAASDALEKNAADYTEINASINTATTEIAKTAGAGYLYTASSRQAVQTAIDAVVSTLTIENQDTIDGWKTAIDTAVGNLVKNSAEYETLDVTIAAAEEKRDTKVSVRGEEVYLYTKTSRDAVTAEIEKVERDKKIDEQDEVDAYITAINSASDALVKKDADYTEINVSIDAATTEITKKIGAEYLYTQATRQAVQTAIDAVVSNLTIENQDTIDGWKTAIDQAVASLEKASADYSVLNSAITAATTAKETKVDVRGNQEYLYTESTRTAVETAINNVVYNLKIDEQEQVNGYTTAINTASNNLQKNVADYTEVNTSINTATTEIAKTAGAEYLYTQISREAVQAAIDTVVNNLTIERQNDIDTWKSNIDTAVAALVKNSADYSALNSTIIAATTTKETKISARGEEEYLYTEATRQAVQTAINNVVEGLYIDQQETVDSYTSAINSAVSSLSKNDADYSLVQAAIIAATTATDTQSLIRGENVYIYTTTSRNAVASVINSVEEGLKIDEQDTVDDYATAINQAVAALEEKDASYDLVNAAISNAQEIIAEKVGNNNLYTDDSIAAVNTAINAVVSGRKVTAQAEVDGYATAIDQEVAALEKNTADYSAVNSAITSANTAKETKVNVRGQQVYLYTQPTRQAVENAINAVVYNLPIDEQEAVNGYVTSIEQAVAGLAKENASYDLVEASIAAANTAKDTEAEIRGQNVYIYTNESRTSVTNAINAVVYNLKIDDQATVDGYATAIDQAVAVLEEKGADYSLVETATTTATTEINKSVEGTTLYTSESISYVQAALNAVVSGRKITSQAEVDGWATAIDQAVSNLVKNSADYTSLNSAVTAATTKKETKVDVRGNQEYLYTESTRQAVENAINAVQYNLPIDEQDTVNGYVTAINSASGALEKNAADYTDIITSIDTATTEIAKTAGAEYLYTENTREAVQTAIAAVEENLTIERQNDIDAWKTAIDQAVSNLVKKPADYTQLENAKTAAITKKERKVDVRGNQEYLYSESTRQAVEDAINAVQYNLTIEYQSTVNGYTAAINSASGALEKNAADYTAVNTSIDAATTEIAKTAGAGYLYTQTSRQAVQTAIDAVVNDLTIERQNDIDAWKTAIDAAVGNLVKNDANYETLDATIAAAEEKRDTKVSVRDEEVYLYTKTSRDAVTAEIEKVERDKKIDEQDEIDSYITAINAASADLEKKASDYTEINASINTATTKITKHVGAELLYTQESINRVQAAIDVVEYDLTIEYQDEIDDWKDSIDAEVDRLEKNSADYTALENAKTAATTKKETKVDVRGNQEYLYTESTRTAVETAINNVVYNLKIDEQDEVDSYTTAINTASNALTKVAADYSAITTSINTATNEITKKAGAEYLYTESTRQAVQTAIDAVVNNLTIERQNDIDTWKSSIDTAVAALVKNTADYTAVNNAVTAATTKKEIKTDVAGVQEYVYTEATRQAVENAINAVQYNLPIDQQETVNGYATAINTASNALEKVAANYENINNAIDAATDKITEKYLSELLYTNDSIARVQAAIDAVEYNLTIERQNDINEWQSSINTAVQALVKNTAHYDELNEMISSATSKANTQVLVRETEEYLYTAETRAAVTNQINAVQYNLPIDQQEEVDEFTRKIENAKNSLAKRTAYYDKVETAITNATNKKDTQSLVRGENVYIYTDTTRETVQTAINAVVLGKPLDEQETVDGYATTINTSSDALEEKDADYDLVDEAKSRANTELAKTAEGEALYTTETVQVVTEALGQVAQGRKITAQAEVDGWATAINDAVTALEKKSANYDSVTNAITTATAKKETKVDVAGEQQYLYTENTRQALETTINNVVYNLKIDEQDTVNGYATAINDASNNLEKVPADYTAINIAIDTATTEITKKVGAEYLYTESTRQAVQAAIAAVEENLTIERQNDINNWKTEIDNAVEDLEKNAADYTELNSAKEAAISKRDTMVTVRGNNEYLYTESTRQAVQAAINNINYEKKIDEQADVNAYTTAINQASANLVEESADYTEVNASIDIATTEINRKAGDQYLYTISSRTAVQNAIDAVTLNLNISMQDDIDIWKANIDTAVGNLVKNSAEYETLDTTIAAAEEKRDTTVSVRGEEVYLYTKTSRDAVTAEIEKVERDKNIDEQDEVDAYITLITNAADSLEKVLADYTEINASIDAATTEITKHVGVELLYTQESINNVQAAINAVEENLTIEHQDEIDAKKTAIDTAVSSLEKNAANYTELENVKTAAITKRDTKVSARGNEVYQYTESTRQAVTDTINSINYQKKIDQQEEVDAYITAITEAASSLVKENADYTEVNASIDAATTEITKHAGEKYLYTESTRQAVQDAIDVVEYGLTIERQDDIDTWKTNIDNAVSNLDKAYADYTEVNTIIYEYQHSDNYINNWYTDDSKTTVDNYIENINYSIRADQQDQVNAITVELAHLMDNLVLKPADYSEVDQLVYNYQHSEGYINNWYTTSSKNTVDEYIESYEKELTINLQDNVTTIKNTLNNYISQLVLLDADYTALDTAIYNYHNDEYYKKQWYTEDSMLPIETFISNYNKELKIDHQNEVNTMVTSFNNMIGNLELISADYTEANEILEQAESLNTKTDSGKDLYTEKTYNTLQAAINEYKNMNKNYKITNQDLVDAAKENIQNAIHALEKNPADYTKLNELISEINKLNKDNYKDFSAIEKAMENIVYEKKIDEQDEVDAMYKTLEKAYKALEEKATQEKKEVIIKSIKINGNEVDLTQSPFKYTVDSATNNVDIEVILEDEKQEYEISGDKNITVGENEFIITIGKNKYKLIIIRQEASNYLKELIIDGYELKFDKKKEKYQLTIALSDYKLKIKAIPEDELAKVEIKGNENVINDSKIEIIVTGTDGEKRTYTLEITKELVSYVSIDPETNESIPLTTEEKITKYAVPAIVGTGTTISLFSLLALVFRKRF